MGGHARRKPRRAPRPASAKRHGGALRGPPLRWRSAPLVRRAAGSARGPWPLLGPHVRVPLVGCQLQHRPWRVCGGTRFSTTNAISRGGRRRRRRRRTSPSSLLPQSCLWSMVAVVGNRPINPRGPPIFHVSATACAPTRSLSPAALLHNHDGGVCRRQLDTPGLEPCDPFSV